MWLVVSTCLGVAVGLAVASYGAPGIRLIRWLSLGPLKSEAEYRARTAAVTVAGAGSP